MKLFKLIFGFIVLMWWVCYCFAIDVIFSVINPINKENTFFLLYLNHKNSRLVTKLELFIKMSSLADFLIS